MAFYILLTYLYQPVKDLASINVEVRAALASVKRVFEYLDVSGEVVDPDNPVKLGKVRGQIVFDHVSFRYVDDGFKLSNCSFEVKEGEKVAIVGPSGSGKSTIAGLLMRFFIPDSGGITLDGVDIQRLRLTDLRNAVSLVEQDPFLFRATIVDNIAYGDPKATRERLVRAAETANVTSFTDKMPDGLNSMVGERGVTLSGGQKQRICLARTVVRDPAVIILDEAMSAVDTESERLILEALSRVLEGRTAIIISHRLTTARHADRILVLDNGKIVGHGSHEELLENSQVYSTLARAQQSA
jgi:ABC-type multidrug transport system fused ATPase/permease subunit